MVQASNNFTITGHLTAKPEVKQTKNGKAYAYPSIAVKGVKKDDVQFISFLLWDKLAENIAKYCDKGDLISVMGSISYVKNEKGSYLQLTGDAVAFLSKAQKKEEAPKEGPKFEPEQDNFTPAQAQPQADIFAPFN